MNDFALSRVDRSILLRHIERKLIELGENEENLVPVGQRAVLTFGAAIANRADRESNRGPMPKVGSSEVILTDEKMLVQTVPVNEPEDCPILVRNEVKIGETATTSVARPVVSFSTQQSIPILSEQQQFSLFNASPPMDLDQSSDSSLGDIDQDDDNPFMEAFITTEVIVNERRNVIDSVKDLFVETDCLSIEIDGDSLILTDRRCKDSTRALVSRRHSWVVIYVLCYCQSRNAATLSVITFSSKIIVRDILESCQVDLSFSATRLNAILAFLCDHPLIDLQLGHNYLNPGENACRTVDDLRRFFNPKGTVTEPDQSSDKLDLFDLYDRLLGQITRLNSLDAFIRISCSVNAILAGLEFFGIAIDLDSWKQFQINTKSVLQSLENQVIAAGGSQLCLTSPICLREILYTKLKLHDNLSEKRQSSMGIKNLIKIRSTNETILSKLAAFHPLPDLIIKYRQINKIRAIYVDSYMSFMDHDKRRICGTWDQSSAITGRIYCSKPNLQAFPRSKYKDMTPGISIDVKSLFLSSNNYTYVSADFFQIELRLYAHLAQDTRLIDLFLQTDNNKEDLFVNLGKMIGLKQSAEENGRQITKRVLYSCLYGIGSGSLANILSISMREAKDMLRLIRKYLPCLEEFASHCMAEVQKRNYMDTIVGRRRYFRQNQNLKEPEKQEFRRQIMSYVIQGSAADICKVAMINCQRRIGYRHLDSILILSRHDELVWRVNNDCLIEMIDIVYKMMEIDAIRYKIDNSRYQSIDLRVPMKIRVKRGNSLTELEYIEHLLK